MHIVMRWCYNSPEHTVTCVHAPCTSAHMSGEWPLVCGPAPQQPPYNPGPAHGHNGDAGGRGVCAACITEGQHGVCVCVRGRAAKHRAGCT